MYIVNYCYNIYKDLLNYWLQIIKDKAIPVQAVGEWRYSLTNSLNLVRGGASHSGRFTTWETVPVPTDQEAAWTVERVWTFGRHDKTLSLLGFEPQTVQPVA